jgi:hypothetical protein
LETAIEGSVNVGSEFRIVLSDANPNTSTVGYVRIGRSTDPNPISLNIDYRIVPEPSTLALSALGFLSLVGFGQRRKR